MENNKVIKFVKVHEKASMIQATEGDLIDLVAVDCEIKRNDYGQVILIYSTGFHFEIPEGYFMDIRPRSSIYKKNLVIANSPGTVDPGYRGEVKILFRFIGDHPPTNVNDQRVYQIGDRVAQFNICKREANISDFYLVEELSATGRGDGGFGSTGA